MSRIATTPSLPATSVTVTRTRSTRLPSRGLTRTVAGSIATRCTWSPAVTSISRTGTPAMPSVEGTDVRSRSGSASRASTHCPTGSWSGADCQNVVVSPSNAEYGPTSGRTGPNVSV